MVGPPLKRLGREVASPDSHGGESGQELLLSNGVVELAVLELGRVVRTGLQVSILVVLAE
jgi:hypothetical protein